jgi:hypothetical protein
MWLIFLAPTMTWNSISVQPAITSGTHQAETSLRQALSFEVQSALWQVLPPATIIFAE